MRDSSRLAWNGRQKKAWLSIQGSNPTFDAMKQRRTWGTRLSHLPFGNDKHPDLRSRGGEGFGVKERADGAVDGGGGVGVEVEEVAGGRRAGFWG